MQGVWYNYDVKWPKGKREPQKKEIKKLKGQSTDKIICMNTEIEKNVLCLPAIHFFNSFIVFQCKDIDALLFSSQFSYKQVCIGLRM